MKRWIALAAAAGLLVVLPQIYIESGIYARVLSIAGICLLLWIGEIVPPFVPTLLLWTLVPLFLGTIDSDYSLTKVLSWAMDPVMVLFFGGFVLGAATKTSGLDKRLTRFALRSAGTSFTGFLLLVIGLTAFLSMWMSNIAAAALVLACLRPVLETFEDDDILRRVTLIGVALGADFGGIATPIGTGPNAIAIASISSVQPVSFLSWMLFAFPLTIGMLTVSSLFLLWRVRGSGVHWKEKFDGPGNILPEDEQLPDDQVRRYGFIAIVVGTVILWLTEPFHKIPSAVVALGAAALIFISGILGRKDLRRIDWSTLLLIAGGITLGRMLEQSGMIKTLTSKVAFGDFHPTAGLFLLCLTAAVFSALMSNTATAVLFIPLALALVPSPSTAIMIAVSASFGIPFLISTPPNAMAFGQGGVRFSDLFWPGIVLMILGCSIVSLTGPAVLKFAGIP